MNKRFRTDGKAIFMESAETDDELHVLNLMNDNFEMKPVIHQSLFDSIFYVDDLARNWTPNPLTKRVIIDPVACFGHPAIKDFWIPTRKLYDAYLVEGSIGAVAEEYAIDESAVVQAVNFEQGLDGQPLH